MGLSASQARLLSITARLTDNEYHSQQIANAKMRLANASNEARTDYQNALNSSVLIYNGFDTEGKATSTTLTPNVIYQYQPLKNQYALLNTAGQVLVNKTDADNFAQTNNLAEFLDRYGVLDKSTTTEWKYKDDVVTVKNPQYKKDWDKWNEDRDDRLKKYNDRLKELENWEPDPNDMPKPEDYTKTITTFTFGESTESRSMYEIFKEASEKCFDRATENKERGCYKHVLAHMIDLTLDDNMKPINYPKNITTTTGKTMEFFSSEITSSAINSNNKTPYMLPVSNVIRDGYDPKNGDPVQILMAAEHETPDESGTESEKIISDYYLRQGNATEEQKLLSNYKIDASGNIVQKTLLEKCKDLMYEIQSGHADYDGVMIPLIKSFQDDMNISLKGINIIENSTEIPDPDGYQEALDRWNTPPDIPPYTEPPKPTTPEYITKIVSVPYTENNINMEINDLEKAQWYINLWYRMNGQTESARIQTKEGYEDNMDYYRKYVVEALNVARNEFSDGYQVLDANLASSSTWLQDVLSMGIVVMQRVNNDKLDTQFKYNWKDIIYTDASELTQERDDNAIARAEVAYEQKMKEIEAKDKRYQLEINKLDSEHNALQTQIESIRSEVSKNIERSFKAFS